MTSATPSLVSSAPWAQRALRRFVPVVGVLGLLSLVTYYRMHPDLPFIRSDGYGYHLYLTAAFVQHDLSFRTEAAEWGADLDYNMGLTRDETTGRYLNRFPPGQALLMLPAFLAAHFSAPLLGFRQDGFSLPYHFAAALNGLCALLIGLTLLKRALEALFPAGVVLALLVAYELFLMVRYWQDRLPGDRTTWAQYRSLFTLP
ncbi:MULTISPECIES: hypothetical protein [unclassified Corallococcus]|uniref:hypothetical protein n=1 Tax=unclassified Corallococcus TaxID=2685029 RepID=UPI001A90B56A|nr:MULTISPECIES: hypothetical protein [unclassified Corallococcus]MBN9682771.1 hypothetical protein [Corallococcus sp. NCSPR001]WAS85690.1 hypothetical protein O0N60_01655 [Corallococcus sp. NCRR]